MSRIYFALTSLFLRFILIIMRYTLILVAFLFSTNAIADQNDIIFQDDMLKAARENNDAMNTLAIEQMEANRIARQALISKELDRMERNASRPSKAKCEYGPDGVFFDVHRTPKKLMSLWRFSKDELGDIDLSCEPKSPDCEKAVKLINLEIQQIRLERGW